jgi:hypothetical protein
MMILGRSGLMIVAPRHKGKGFVFGAQQSG